MISNICSIFKKENNHFLINTAHFNCIFAILNSILSSKSQKRFILRLIPFSSVYKHRMKNPITNEEEKPYEPL